MNRPMSTGVSSLFLFAVLSLGGSGASEAALSRTGFVNLPRHLPQVQVQASSVLGGYAAENAVDGKPGTRWDSGVKASPGNPQWVLVDLGGLHEIARVNLLGPTPGQKAFYSVSVSEDKESWIKILPRGMAAGRQGAVTGPEALRISTREPVLAQYVKYEVFGGSWRHTARLGEIRIIGDPNAQVRPVPIPAGIWLMGSGLVLLAGMRRTRRQPGLA